MLFTSRRFGVRWRVPRVTQGAAYGCLQRKRLCMLILCSQLTSPSVGPPRRQPLSISFKSAIVCVVSKLEQREGTSRQAPPSQPFDFEVFVTQLQLVHSTKMKTRTRTINPSTMTSMISCCLTPPPITSGYFEDLNATRRQRKVVKKPTLDDHTNGDGDVDDDSDGVEISSRWTCPWVLILGRSLSNSDRNTASFIH